MRNTIALNLDNFRAAPEGFTARPAHAPIRRLRVVAAPFASVIVPNYNGVRHLPVVLGALRARHFTDFEMIVVDDASTDDFGGAGDERYPDVRVIENRTNLGFVRACNTGRGCGAWAGARAAQQRHRAGAHLAGGTGQGVRRQPQCSRGGEQAAALRPARRCTAPATCSASTVCRAIAASGKLTSRPVRRRGDQVFSGCGGASLSPRGVAGARRLRRVISGCIWRMSISASARGCWATRCRLCARKPASITTSAPAGGDVLASYYVGRNTIWLIAKNMPRRAVAAQLPLLDPRRGSCVALGCAAQLARRGGARAAARPAWPGCSACRSNCKAPH
jgi:hypothetical protein